MVLLALVAASLSMMLIVGAGAATTLAFRAPVFVTHDVTEQAGEPSIRVDATGPKQRIWVAAPTYPFALCIAETRSPSGRAS